MKDWLDFKLRWNPQKYSGIRVVRIPHQFVWRPDILLYNKYSDLFFDVAWFHAIGKHQNSYLWAHVCCNKSLKFYHSLGKYVEYSHRLYSRPNEDCHFSTLHCEN